MLKTYCLLFIVCFSSCSQDKDKIAVYLNKADFKPDGTTVYLCNYSAGAKIIDSAKVTKNYVEFNVPETIQDNPYVAAIKTKDSFNGKPYLKILVGYKNPFYKNEITSHFIIDGSITFKPDLTNENTYSIKYSKKENNELLLQKAIFKYYTINDNLQRKEQFKKDLNFVRENNSSYYLLSLLYGIRSNSKKEETITLLKAFSSKLQNTTLANSILEYYNHQNNLSTSYNYKLTSSTNKKELIFDTSSQTQLIVFWASWCTPCRKEIPLLKKIYTKINTKTTVFTSISIESEKENWLEAVKQEQMPWRQLFTETTEEINEIQKVFNIKQIPLLYLKTKDSLMLIKSLEDDKLKEYLKT